MHTGAWFRQLLKSECRSLFLNARPEIVNVGCVISNDKLES